ncbi:hypothetical protein QJS10_CPB11g00890 [Acorus calamus]|uniref:Uncharacterized protein n=1 Tax=Acorus calamus TaxID=4465 RepID=A0AAV9DQ21_ACOCL|nr:hypothetical protein QJS10_CPB11g00890 [Acorus calamus]
MGEGQLGFIFYKLNGGQPKVYKVAAPSRVHLKCSRRESQSKLPCIPNTPQAYPPKSTPITKQTIVHKKSSYSLIPSPFCVRLE